jgi:lactoylglutathione lyase
MKGVTKGNNAVAFWGVQDIKASYQRVLGLGAQPNTEVTDVGGDIRVATVKDPFGNILGLIENPHFKIESEA